MRPFRSTVGLLIIFIGLIMLFNALNIISVSWQEVAGLWPVLLIVWGLAILTGGGEVFWLAVLVVVVAASLLVSDVVRHRPSGGDTSAWGKVRYWTFQLTERFRDNRDAGAQQETLSTGYTSDITTAVLNLDHGAGTVRGGNPATNRLIVADTSTSFGRYTMDTSTSNGTETVSISLKNSGANWFNSSVKNNLELFLNTQPDWEINLNSGASDIDLNLEKQKVRKMDIRGGASSMKFRLSGLLDRADIDLRVGASSVTLQVPNGTGVELDNESGLTGLKLEGFERDGRYYRSAGFSDVAKKVYIVARTGVSSLNVEQY